MLSGDCELVDAEECEGLFFREVSFDFREFEGESSKDVVELVF